MNGQKREVEALARRIATLIEQAATSDDAAELLGAFLGPVLVAAENAFKKPLPIIVEILGDCMRRYAKSRES